MNAPDNRPVAEVRFGAVKAAIWENDTEGGDVYHSVTFERLYRTDGDWRSTSSFRGGDLLLLAKVADAAHTRVLELRSPAPEGDAG